MISVVANEICMPEGLTTVVSIVIGLVEALFFVALY